MDWCFLFRRTYSGILWFADLRSQIFPWGSFCSVTDGSCNTSTISFKHFSPCCCTAAEEAFMGFVLQEIFLLWTQLFLVMSESRGLLPHLIRPLDYQSASLIPPLFSQCCYSLVSRGAAGLWFVSIFLGGVLLSNVLCFTIWVFSCNTLAMFKMHRFCAIW